MGIGFGFGSGRYPGFFGLPHGVTGCWDTPLPPPGGGWVPNPNPSNQPPTPANTQINQPSHPKTPPPPQTHPNPPPHQTKTQKTHPPPPTTTPPQPPPPPTNKQPPPPPPKPPTTTQPPTPPQIGLFFRVAVLPLGPKEDVSSPLFPFLPF